MTERKLKPAPNNLWQTLTARYQSSSAMKGVSSPRLRNALFALFIAAILAYGAAFAAYMLTRFDLFNIIRDVNNDDSFYYFQIAYNLAEGKFSTFDGGISRTNGYHPLWMFAVTPFYWLFDKEAALFAIKAFEIMLVAGGVALIAVAARLARLPWILLFALPPMLYGVHALTAGMEAALALFMLGALFLSVMLYARSPARWKWLLAGVAFALPWVRLEYIAISLAATGALCLMELSWRDKPFGASWRELMHTLSRLQALPSLLAAVAGILVYFAYNQLVFGGILPVSAATKREWSQAWWNEYGGGYSLVQNLQAALEIRVFHNNYLLAVLGISACFLLIWWFARRSRSRDDWLTLAFLVCVFSLAAGHLAKFAQTVLTTHPFIQGHFSWYFVPAYLMMALVVPIAYYIAVYCIRHFVAPMWHIAANILITGVVIVGTVFLLITAFLLTDVGFGQPFRFVDRASDATTNPDEWAAAIYGGTLVTNRLLPEGSVIGSWDAGVIGYFSRHPVVNLDGLVNSYDYYHATNVITDGYAYSKDGEFKPLYRELGITHFANLSSIGFSNLIFQGSLTSGERQFDIGLYELTEDFDAAWFYERMKPHFHYESDGIGLIVDDRLAQAFTQDCEPDELAVWSWSGQASGPIAITWAETQTGLCTTTVVLPHDAALPIRVEAMSADDYFARLIGNDAPVIRSNYDVYLTENRLIYAKEQCAEDDTAPQFFLHIDPLNRSDLPLSRNLYGFDNLDFGFEWQGEILDGNCVAIIPLPDYDIAEIRTGQYVPVDGAFKRLWEGKINLTE